MPNMTNTELWDGREPITDALVRLGLRDAFQVAVDERNREVAVSFLCDVGANEVDAACMVDILIPAEKTGHR